MARRETKPSRREENTRNAKRKAGVFTGLVIGITLGIVFAAGLVWYFNMWSGSYKSEADSASVSVSASVSAAELNAEDVVSETVAAPAPEITPPTPTPAPSPAQPAKVETKAAAQTTQPAIAKPSSAEATSRKVESSKTLPPKPVAQQKTATTASSKQPAVPEKQEFPYTFYDILPGDKQDPALKPTVPQDSWWLQIAALSDATKAEQIRLRLKSLKLRASVQKIISNGQPLYRIRVGPYAQETDSFGDLDVLTDNELNARLIKDPLSQP